jgi:LuxR family maltose regulon positive regulatory protein
MTILSSCNLAATLILLGQLRRAAATFRGALQFADESAGSGAHRLPFTGLASTGLATVLREWNDLEMATYHAREGIELSEQWGQAEVIMHGYVEWAQVLQACGNEGSALDAMQKAMQIAQNLSPWTATYVAATKARLHLKQGDLAAASHWARESGLGVEDRIDFEHVINYVTLARVLIAQGRLDEASRLLAQLSNMAEAAGAMGYGLEILVLEAMAYRVQDAQDSALGSLARALSLAELEGYVRTFVDEGKPMVELLRNAAARGIAVEYVGKLLALFGESGRAGSSSGEQALIEPLSEREVEVLRLVVAGLSNREIAEQLFLAIGTVKKHLSNIYGKLSVNRRAQAIARAGELNLV